MKRARLCLAVLALSTACDGKDERGQSANLLLISIDTLRADRLGCYGYARATSPALDRFADEHAVRFARVVAESPWTLPSHVTLLSGLHPLHHGVRLPEHVPAQEIEFLAQTLRERAYYTFGVTGGGWISADFGFDRGFDSFHASEADFAKTVRKATEYIRYRSGKSPWFGFLHTFDVHCPYDPQEPYFSMFASEGAEPIEVADRCGDTHFNALELSAGQASYLSDRYDESIRAVDDSMGELLRFLEESGALEHTVVVITSDHGEEFQEHGRIGHEHSLHREVLEVPLLVAAPGIRPRVVTELVGLADVAPTVLELLGVGARPCDGRSLVPLLRGETSSSASAPRVSDLGWKEDLLSVMDTDEHLVFDRARDELRFFELGSDPQEMKECSAERSSRVQALRSVLERELEQLTKSSLAPGVVRDPEGIEAGAMRD